MTRGRGGGGHRERERDREQEQGRDQSDDDTTPDHTNHTTHLVVVLDLVQGLTVDGRRLVRREQLASHHVHDHSWGGVGWDEEGQGETKIISTTYTQWEETRIDQ